MTTTMPPNALRFANAKPGEDGETHFTDCYTRDDVFIIEHSEPLSYLALGLEHALSLRKWLNRYIADQYKKQAEDGDEEDEDDETGTESSK